MSDTTTRQLPPRQDLTEQVTPGHAGLGAGSVNYTPQPLAKDLFEEPLRRLASNVSRTAVALSLRARRVTVTAITRR